MKNKNRAWGPINKIKKVFSNMTLAQKLFTIFEISAGIGLILAIASYQIVVHAYNERLYEQLYETMSYFAGNLEENLQKIENLAGVNISDSTIQRDMVDLKDTESRDYLNYKFREELDTVLEKNFYSKNNLLMLTLIRDGVLVASSGKNGTTSTASLYRKLNLLDTPMPYPDKSWIPVEQDHSVIYLRTIRKIENMSLDELGYLAVRVDLVRMIQNCMNSKYRDNEDYMLHISFGDDVYYSSEEELTEEVRGMERNQYRICDVGGRKMFVVSNYIPTYQWTIYYGISYDTIFHSLRLVQWLCVILLILDILVASVVWKKGVSGILWHFTYLTNKIRRFQNQQESTFEPEVYDYRDGKDEISLLHRSFDEMTVQIQELIRENYEKQLLIRDTKIRILEQQMNPHFLQNMLQVIEWHAKLGDRDKTASIIHTLGSFLRSTLQDYDEQIPLEREIQTVEEYISLMKVCYVDELSFHLDMEDDCSGILIPRMTIQPLVENGLHYGLNEDNDTVEIDVNIYCKDNRLYVEVSNTGSSIETDILERLESGEIKPGGNGIGLKNIQERIQLLYGKEYGLRFFAGEGCSTVTVEIPCAR